MNGWDKEIPQFVGVRWENFYILRTDATYKNHPGDEVVRKEDEVFSSTERLQKKLMQISLFLKKCSCCPTTEIR